VSVGICLIGLATLLSAAQLDNLSDEEVLARAEASFRDGIAARQNPEAARPHFAAAADAFQALYERGVMNADLLRNLGNASLLGGRLPQALLAYRRGLCLDPHDAALQEALENARDEVNYPQPGRIGRPPPPSWPAWLPYPAPGLLLGLALGTYYLACVLGTRWLLAGGGRVLIAAAAALAISLASGTAWGVMQWQQFDEAAHPLVVVAADGVSLHTGNGPSYPQDRVLPELRRGMEARLLYARGDWLQIELAGGQSGWVRRAQVLVDTPS
jgi:hypothetical protein